MNFKLLLQAIKETHLLFQQQAIRAVNTNLTLRNWFLGYYVIAFEQNGEDRAKYGDKLLTSLSKTLSIKGLSETNFKQCRRFYTVYPEILGLLTQEFYAHPAFEVFTKISAESPSVLQNRIRQTVSDELKKPKYLTEDIRQTVSDQSDTVNNLTYLGNLLQSASFSHFIELIKIDDPVKRKFYELVIVKTNPSVRELQRQIETLTFERIGLSSDKETAFRQLSKKINPAETSDLVKSHYFFEFLNLGKPHLIEESDLEQALIEHLQEFILELGYGFCFEARQKRILIDDEYYFIDLVFYHRILKCHVLIELKTEHAKHEHIGQLKVYLQHYKRKVMSKDDNPPVGILLVTDKKNTLVEYAVADSDKKLFVSKYQLQLPDKAALETFIKKELSNI